MIFQKNNNWENLSFSHLSTTPKIHEKNKENFLTTEHKQTVQIQIIH